MRVFLRSRCESRRRGTALVVRAGEINMCVCVDSDVGESRLQIFPCWLMTAWALTDAEPDRVRYV